jgi:hypothetical protein
MGAISAHFREEVKAGNSKHLHVIWTPRVYTVVRVIESKRMQKRFVVADDDGVQVATPSGTSKQFRYRDLQLVLDDTVSAADNSEAYRVNRLDERMTDVVA